MNAIEFQPVERPLSPWGLPASASRGRRHPEAAHPLRGPFERDRDRIVHSGAFRRLIAKTQVFVGQPDDLQRTRLTHTLEVAQIARTIARHLGLNEDLTEAIALAHDVGHPPFGHAGERALAERMQGHGGFEHNRQGVRVLDLLEHPYPEFAGLNLSIEVLECMALRSHEEHPDLQSLRTVPRMWLEGQAVDAADSIAYNAHDAQDALRAGTIAQEQISQLNVWQAAVEHAKIRHADLGNGAVQHASVLRAMLDMQVRNVISSSKERLQTISDPQMGRRAANDLICLDDFHRQQKAELSQFLGEKVYRDDRVQQATRSGAAVIGELFDELTTDPSSMPESFSKRLAHESRQRVVCDFIACMTDRYARNYRLRMAKS